MKKNLFKIGCLLIVAITFFGNTYAQEMEIKQSDKKIISSEAFTEAQNNVPLDKQQIKKPPRQLPSFGYNFSNVQICVDYASTNSNLSPRNFNAIALPPKINSNGTVSNIGVIRQPLAGENNSMWDPGATLTVFLSNHNLSTSKIRGKVIQYAKEWERFANIKFNFISDSATANVKVGFVDGSGSWSYIGKNCNTENTLGYTMNFGWLTDKSTEAEISRVVIHEFGHSLGLIHEHQSASANIDWDKEKVYAYFAKAPNNWSKTEVDQNVFAKYTSSNTNYSAYDPLSIMHYFYPTDLTKTQTVFTKNTQLSNIDKSFIRDLYPFKNTPPTVIGNLATGDDCDDIQFKVEYDAAGVPNGEVQFELKLGSYNNKPVTWWKSIQIPLTNGTLKALEQENTQAGTSVFIPLSSINTDQAIAFFKAKFLGVHTQVNFGWDVLRALVSKCKVTLIWNRDTCNP